MVAGRLGDNKPCSMHSTISHGGAMVSVSRTIIEAITYCRPALQPPSATESSYSSDKNRLLLLLSRQIDFIITEDTTNYLYLTITLISRSQNDARRLRSPVSAHKNMQQCLSDF